MNVYKAQNRAGRLQKGLTLMELMIALALGLVITIAMIGLFLNSKQSYRLNDNMSRLQENARFAVQYLARDLRMADWRTCVTQDGLDNALTGANNSGLNSSDTVTILWQLNECGTAASTTTTIYSIQNGAGGQPALFRAIDGGTAVELVEGIEDLQILIGEDTDGDYVPNYYVDPSSVVDPADVVAARFTLVARTPEANVTPSQSRITRDFTSVVTLRNRVP